MIVIFYHKDDNDGVFSGALIKYYLVSEMNKSESEIKLIPSDYDILNNLDQSYIDDLVANCESVFMTDVSFNDIKRMKNFCSHSNVYWFDHHAPIIKESYKNKFDDVHGLRDTNCSALMCVYRYLFTEFDTKWREGGIPKELDMLSAFDSFTFEKRGFTQEDCYNYNTYITNKYNLNIDKVYDSLFFFVHYAAGDDLITDWIRQGKEYNEGYLNHWTRVIEDAGDFTWNVDGRPAVAMFIQGPTGSILFGKSKKCKSVKNAIVFKRIPSGSWGLSLYNLDRTDTFDCGAYLKKKYGGGGHLGAAGCSLAESKFIKILKDRTL